MHYIYLVSVQCREYQALTEHPEAEREWFMNDAATRGLSRREQRIYADANVHALPDFVEWLPQYTSVLVNEAGSSNVDIELLRLSALPSRDAETYLQMWAYGNHYRVANETDNLGFVT